MQSLKEIQFQFRPVAPTQLDEGQKMRVLKVSKNLEDLAGDVFELVPEGENRERILRHLLDVKFWCVQEITHQAE